jgi:hypothetical protein
MIWVNGGKYVRFSLPRRAETADEHKRTYVLSYDLQLNNGKTSRRHGYGFDPQQGTLSPAHRGLTVSSSHRRVFFVCTNV